MEQEITLESKKLKSEAAYAKFQYNVAIENLSEKVAELKLDLKNPDTEFWQINEILFVAFFHYKKIRFKHQQTGTISIKKSISQYRCSRSNFGDFEEN